MTAKTMLGLGAMMQQTITPFQCELPPGEFLPYEKFIQSFQLGNASTEQSHPATTKLSQTMQKDTSSGLEQLLEVDESVIKGYQSFVNQAPNITTSFIETLSSSGRVILVGSGSSGRIAIDLAAKCASTIPCRKDQIIGVIAGGDATMVRAREGFEDSVKDGEQAMANLKVGPKDIVLLISASGSASFNVGAGHFSANEGAKVYYFYNSKEVPERTLQLFNRNNNPVEPLLIDTGAQSINGSTRLQAASLAESCLGMLLEYTAFCSMNEEKKGQSSPLQIMKGLKRGQEVIEQNLEKFRLLIEKEHEILNSPLSNTRRVRDETDMGYVTLIGKDNVAREICIDTTEVPPTFNKPFYRREGESQPKRPPFQAYIIGKQNNLEAWTSLLGRNPQKSDLNEVNRFIFDTNTDGENSFAKRPKGKGNMVIGVAKLNNEKETLDPALRLALDKAIQQGADSGLIIVSATKINLSLKFELEATYPNLILLEEVPNDPMGVCHTLVLKQALNLISNGAMVLGGNVYGNRMINVRASNNKLIDRAMREVTEIWHESYPQDILDQKVLYHFIIHNSVKIKEEEAKGNYNSSIVKLTLAMLYLKKTPKEFEEVAKFLLSREESLSFLPGGT